jgi:hypothetical protein
MLLILIDHLSWTLMVLASHETSNLLNQPPAVSAFEYLSVLISIVLALGMTRVPGWRRRNAAGSDTPTHLLGACDLDSQPFYLSRCSVVDFLSLAQPAGMDVFALRLRSHVAHRLVSRFNASFSTGRQPRMNQSITKCTTSSRLLRDLQYVSGG